jgi:hypothetical protein
VTWGRKLFLVAAPLAAVLGACFAPRPAALPREFPHEKHLTRPECAELGEPSCFSCETCHQDVSKVDRPSRPSAETCRKCHSAGAELLERVAPKTRPEELLGRSMRFSHGAHLRRPEIAGKCMKCHSGVADPADYDFAAMSTCLTCHQADFDNARCTLCHEQSSLSQLVPTTFLAHSSSWIRDHGLAASRSSKVCNGCHSQQQCTDCHDQTQTIRIALRRLDAVDWELLHRGDWLTQHPIEARSQPATCQRCHSVSSCSSCHARRGVAAIANGSVNPHPLGWVGPDTSSRDFHGRAAKRNIMTCAGCHDQGPATNCIRCHRVGERGGNPHPSGWNSARSPNAAMCRFCHEP